MWCSLVLCQNFLLILRNLESAGSSELSRSFVAKSPNPAITWNTHRSALRATENASLKSRSSWPWIFDETVKSHSQIMDLNLGISELVCSLCSSAACLWMWNTSSSSGSKGMLEQVFRCGSSYPCQSVVCFSQFSFPVTASQYKGKYLCGPS